MDKVDYSTLFLTSQELESLERYAKQIEFPKDDPCFSRLASFGFIGSSGGAPDGLGGFINTKYIINESGRHYLEYYKTQINNRKRDSRRYWITTTIAIFALIIAAVDLLLHMFQ